MEDRKSWLEMILKRKSFNESPLQVVAVEDASGVVGKGENYLSEIERVRATVLLGSGKTKKISLIIKNQHETEQMKKLSLELGVFFREITMYRDILPKMEDLLDEIKEEEDLLWGRCYDYRLYDRLVFEDLNEAGFRMADRKKQLGLQAALLVVKNLAKFHALSKILLDRGEIPLDVFGKHIWAREPEISKRMVTENAERLLKVMKTWGDEWQEASERFEKAIPDLGKKFAEELTVKPDEFAVLCHGDCWTNNMLFKGEDLENPTAVKLLDLQISFLSTPAWDLHYFFKTSVRLEVRKKHTDQILQEYVNSWKSLTSRLPYGAFVPDVDYVKENMRKKAVFALEYCTNLISIITGDTRDNADLEDVMKAVKEAEDKGEKIPAELWDLSKMMTPNTINIIKDIITDSIEFGIIFIDMQVCCRDSPMRDLYYFLLSSVRLEVRNQHIDKLLQAYVDSVKHYLLRLQYEGPIPDMGSIQEVFKKKKAYSLEFAITFVPIATGETQNIPDLETIAQAMAEAQEKGEKLTDGLWDVTSFLSTVGEAIVKDSMKKAMEYGII